MAQLRYAVISVALVQLILTFDRGLSRSLSGTKTNKCNTLQAHFAGKRLKCAQPDRPAVSRHMHVLLINQLKKNENFDFLSRCGHTL